MKIKKLTLSNFMAFENLQLDWSDNINVICGENSTGKTTLLKAMYSLIKPLNEVNRDIENKSRFRLCLIDLDQLLIIPKIRHPVPDRPLTVLKRADR